jgi:hypothetical protein
VTAVCIALRTAVKEGDRHEAICSDRGARHSAEHARRRGDGLAGLRRGAQTAPFPNKPFTLDASFCGFKVLWDAPVNKAFIKILKMPG